MVSTPASIRAWTQKDLREKKTWTLAPTPRGPTWMASDPTITAATWPSLNSTQNGMLRTPFNEADVGRDLGQVTRQLLDRRHDPLAPGVQLFAELARVAMAVQPHVADDDPAEVVDKITPWAWQTVEFVHVIS